MKKFIFITLLILLVGLFVFHFIAANQAEKNIDTIIQQQAEAASVSVSVQYSSIEVSPFDGDVQFKDVTIVEGNDIQRTRLMNIDLGYVDFLNIYGGGVPYGLKNITSGTINLSRTSYLNRTTLQEYSIDTLNIAYSGNMWDAVQSIFTQQPAQYSHTVEMKGAGVRYTKPTSSVGTFTADSASSLFDIPKGASQWRTDGTHRFTFTNISWAPPESFKNQYGFFIQGFGFQLDAIPFQKFAGTYSMASSSEVKLTEGLLSSELLTANFDGTIATDSTWADARFSPLRVSLVDLSGQFQNVLTNIENLLGVNLPANNDGIHFQLVGPVSSPRFRNPE